MGHERIGHKHDAQQPRSSTQEMPQSRAGRDEQPKARQRRQVNQQRTIGRLDQLRRPDAGAHGIQVRRGQKRERRRWAWVRLTQILPATISGCRVRTMGGGPDPECGLYDRDACDRTGDTQADREHQRVQNGVERSQAEDDAEQQQDL